jgi:cyclic beta-1,2-glucan synthetase
LTAAAVAAEKPSARTAVEADARALAQAQRRLRRARPAVTDYIEISSSPIARALERARKHMASSHIEDARLQKAAEWFLDNYYLIRRVARQVAQELPAGFLRRLPELADESGNGLPRIDALARALVARSSIEIDVTALQRFVDAYQEVSPLTIAELWALPTMLRISVLHGLLQFLEELGVSVHGVLERAPARRAPPDVEYFGLGAGTGVERAVRALRLLAEIDWKTFFEKTNRVEAVLRKDPAQVYARMDFETCDAYRKSVEELAWVTGAAEGDVAELAVKMASANLADPRSGHVGYYLVDRGRATLEARLGYRPRGITRVRRLLTGRPTLSYLSALAITTAGPLLALGGLLAGIGASPSMVSASVLLAVIPASVVAVTVVQWALARVLAPRTLPKLDFSKGLPDGLRALVVIPTLLGRREDVDGMLRQIELHYLSNRDPRLAFALLTDDVDSTTAKSDPSLLESAVRGIEALNAAHGSGGSGPFHLLHRESHWNAAEGRFMGWERKRGKLEELNRLLRGARDTTYSLHAGDPKGLAGVRFVITVDSDTQLPMGTARRLVGLLAHPLNRAVWDDASGRIVSGYSIVQPRIEVSPSSARQTPFARIFAGNVGFDIYTHAVSELYQDLFGAGIYVGKGIYDVDAFMRSVEGRAPENALASHDLFEGIHGRTALATDVVLFEDYPSQYVAYARRMHRWVRGDWQLLPWLFSRVPSADGKRIRSTLPAIDRWKILDNLRRSLTSPGLLALLVAGFCWLPGRPLFWTLGALAVLLLPSLPALLHDRRRRALNFGRAVLAVALLAHETVVVLDAVSRVVARMAFTRKHLLQWTSAAHTAFGLAARSPRVLLWREMIGSPVLAVAIGALVVRTRPSALVVAAPLLVLWLVAPEIARWVSQPARSREEPLQEGERRRLRLLARRTWRFFDVFVGPNDQWLPIDNYQEEPSEQTAHRTSPTNIGMMLLATLAAYDLGYVGPSELALRVHHAFGSIDRLAHYQGHLFNWYDTKSLEPLLPRYVSTVDSGNLAGCLLALAQGCRQIAGAPVLRAAAWEGLGDSLDLVDEVFDAITEPKARAARAVVARMRRALVEGGESPEAAYPTLRVLADEASTELDRELLSLLETGALRHDADTLRALRTSMDRFHHQLRQMRHEIDLLLPWLSLRDEPAASSLAMPAGLALRDVPLAARQLVGAVAQLERDWRERGELSPELEASARRLTEAFERSEARATSLEGELTGLAARAEAEARGMDFRLLYDGERKLFRIGYNATQDQLDAHHYDLLASEARLASYLAIVKGDVPASHWSTLGRPMTRAAGAPLLLSWGGTMFEYLMPPLLMRSRAGTLLAQTCELAVEAHIAYGEETHAPWGVSESAYARVDAHQTYQYRSFGVPGLGFRRGLEDDRVVAPYASVLAASVRPRAVLANIDRFVKMGMLGTYGLFEAVDMRPERADGRPFDVVRSYMAHHQGMLLVAIDNLLHDQVMVERFHADREVETGELLLNERAPATAPPEWPTADHVESVGAAVVEAPLRASPTWSPDAQRRPQAFVLGNGRLSSLLTDSGGGGLRWQGMTITRFQPDVVGDGDGLWFYVRDEESGRLWLATSERGRTTYAAHQVEYHQRDHEISVHVEVTIAPADDVEVRQITLHNESDRTRRLTVTSATEPVLLPAGQAASHPAFARMFVESEHLVELDALLFARRPRAASDDRAVVVHRLVKEGAAVTFAGYETDRGAFFGRGADVRAPVALATAGRPLRGRVGAVLDPFMSVMARVELKPKRTVTFAFVTSVGRTRGTATELARRYGSMHMVRWAFRDAEPEGRRRVARSRLDPDLLPSVQRLLSALVFADPALRTSADVLAAARPCKRRLWGRGISGDDPILLVRVNDPEAPIVRETIAAQRYLRTCGVRFDLVFVDEHASGYLAEGAGTLRGVLAGSEVDEWLGKHGGVFALAADQIRGEERRDLEASARVVLDTTDGSLASRMARPVETAPKLPRFEPTLPDEGGQRAPRRPPLLFDNGIGGFTHDGREYVVSVRPGDRPAAPWCNVLANPTFGCLVSESSLGSTWSVNAGENRLTPWRNDPVFDTPAEVLYLRDEESAVVWSPTPSPAGGDALVRHGMGYTVYAHESHGLVQELTVFVPPDAPVKIARLRVTNTLSRHRRLTATYYAEWVLGGVREEQRPYVVSEHDAAHACLFARCTWSADFADRVAFLASERKVHGFTTDRVAFLGRRGDYARPEGLERWGLAGSLEAGVAPCAALQVHLELAPGEQIVTHFVLGQAADGEEARSLVERFAKAAAVEQAWRELGAFWEGLLGSVRVKTPEPAMDLMLGGWLLYQALSSRFFGRTGFYQSSGAFGYRDQLQDVLAFLHAAPDLARAHILEAAKHQFEEGDVLHWWHPPVGRGVRTRCSDDMAWLPFVTAEYVFATGDASILAERLPFLTGAPLRVDEHDRYAEFPASASTTTLFEHCRRALERGLTEGRHGLPLMGGGDWNDGMNRVGAEGRGESVWLGWFLCATMTRFAALCDRQGARADATEWRTRAESLRGKIDACAWDGGWYVRAFHDDGSVLGSAHERECRIDSIAQSWAVLSGARASDDAAGGDGAVGAHRARVAVYAADEQLVREADRLVLLLTPPFDVTRHDPGYIRAYPPGVRENGGQYTHAATWLGWAYASLGEGEGAERIFRLLNPVLHARSRDESNRYRVEPYVLAGDVYGAPPWVGRGGWTWYTGAAAWLWRLGVEAILGLRREDGDLVIDPCIPPAWKGFEAWVQLGSQSVHVVVENPDAVSRGVETVTLDGSALDSSRIHLDPKVTGEHEVRVRLGAERIAAPRETPRDRAWQRTSAT